MFERFTESARQVVVLAQAEARTLRHHSIGTEHILLGLVGERDGLGARILIDLGADADTIRAARFRLLAGSGGGESLVASAAAVRTPRPPSHALRSGASATAPPRLTREARAVLAHAQEEARALGSPSMGTEHVLLGILREKQGLAARLLGALGVTFAGACAQLAGASGAPVTGHVEFNPQVRDLLEGARRDAVSLDQDCVGAEHLLLGLLHERDGVTARMLRGG